MPRLQWRELCFLESAGSYKRDVGLLLLYGYAEAWQENLIDAGCQCPDLHGWADPYWQEHGP